MRLALALLAASGGAEEFVLFDNPPRFLVAAEVERDGNRGGYLVSWLAPNATTGSPAR